MKVTPTVSNQRESAKPVCKDILTQKTECLICVSNCCLLRKPQDMRATQELANVPDWINPLVPGSLSTEGACWHCMRPESIQGCNPSTHRTRLSPVGRHGWRCHVQPTPEHPDRLQCDKPKLVGPSMALICPCPAILRVQVGMNAWKQHHFLVRHRVKEDGRKPG